MTPLQTEGSLEVTCLAKSLAWFRDLKSMQAMHKKLLAGIYPEPASYTGAGCRKFTVKEVLMLAEIKAKIRAGVHGS